MVAWRATQGVAGPAAGPRPRARSGPPSARLRPRGRSAVRDHEPGARRARSARTSRSPHAAWTPRSRPSPRCTRRSPPRPWPTCPSAGGVPPSGSPRSVPGPSARAHGTTWQGRIRACRRHWPRADGGSQPSCLPHPDGAAGVRPRRRERRQPDLGRAVGSGSSTSRTPGSATSPTRSPTRSSTCRSGRTPASPPTTCWTGSPSRRPTSPGSASTAGCGRSSGCSCCFPATLLDGRNPAGTLERAATRLLAQM